MDKAIVALLALILVSLAAVLITLLQVVKQQGRQLLRLDSLESSFGSPRPAMNRASHVGLEIGTPVGSLTLPDTHGQLVSLEDFRGKRLFLVNWSPQCGFCRSIASDLAVLQQQFAQAGMRLVLAAHGDAEVNRKLATEHGLECLVLLQSEKTRLPLFKHLGTPAAYLLDEEGKVAAPLAVGAEQVPALARKVVAAHSNGKRAFSKRPLSESRIERDGLKLGALAPLFHLPDVYGRQVALEDYRGRRVLLVFTDPHCGPCDELAPYLVRIHREHHPELSVIVVGRGEIEENRRKAEQHRFEFPVVVQEQWRLSKEYGIFSAPVAFLIDEEGVIMRRIAKGITEILALLGDEQALTISAREER